MSLSAILSLRRDETLKSEARKLLSFTDNRQDAALQAGHFNDFIEISLLRAALYRAVAAASPDGLEHAELAQRVVGALELPFAQFAQDPSWRYQPEREARRALQNIVGYRLYRDLRRGWRITSPNLEQSGLLGIEYLSLQELCETDEDWNGTHPALSGALPETRAKIARVLLDFLRRELAIKVDYLDSDFQEQIRQQSGQRLRPPWAVDEQERFEHAAVAFPRPSRSDDFGGNVFVSARSAFGQYLRRRTTLPEFDGRLGLEDTEPVIRQLFEVLQIAGLVQVVVDPANATDVPGYQVPASSMVWLAKDGTEAFYDPLRTPSASAEGGRTNPFFVDFFSGETATAKELSTLEAREHTAQVRYELREERENRFRTADLPILYCSPTMELGVDIAELNAVNLRNVPPTPANYAQRSGRAGRGGQPALVVTYCTASGYSSTLIARTWVVTVWDDLLKSANCPSIRRETRSACRWRTAAALIGGDRDRDVLVVRQPPRYLSQRFGRHDHRQLAAADRHLHAGQDGTAVVRGGSEHHLIDRLLQTRGRDLQAGAAADGRDGRELLGVGLPDFGVEPAAAQVGLLRLHLEQRRLTGREQPGRHPSVQQRVVRGASPSRRLAAAVFDES